MKVTINGGAMPNEELQQYINRANQKFPNDRIEELELTIDGDYVDIRYHMEVEPFQRIRRITGYLVGTLDRFNDGKKAEESQRVKHN